jgi:membrane protein YdbS with pleckstrin-like domain
MNNKLKQMLEQLPAFIILGIAIAVVVGLFIMLSYVLVWGLILGAIIWLGVVIKNYIFPSSVSDKNAGRVIEHDDDENQQ